MQNIYSKFILAAFASRKIPSNTTTELDTGMNVCRRMINSNETISPYQSYLLPLFVRYEIEWPSSCIVKDLSAFQTGCHGGSGPSWSRCDQTAWRSRIPVKAAAWLDYSRQGVASRACNSRLGASDRCTFLRASTFLSSTSKRNYALSPIAGQTYATCFFHPSLPHDR